MSSLDITTALVAELKALKERHIQFQTRLKAANEAARTRDEEARKQNAILSERIIKLESELKHAKESIKVRATPFLFYLDRPELMDCHRLCVNSANYFLLSRAISTHLKVKSKPSRRLGPTLPSSERLHRRLPE